MTVDGSGSSRPALAVAGLRWPSLALVMVVVMVVVAVVVVCSLFVNKNLVRKDESKT